MDFITIITIMESDLEQLVNATRRLGRSRRNRRFRGSMTARRQGEELLQTIRQSGGIPTPRLIQPRDHRELRDDEADRTKPVSVLADIAGFAKRLGDTIATATQPAKAKTRHFSPFPDSPCDVIRRNPKRKRIEITSDTRTPRWSEPPVVDPSARRLAFVGVGLIILLAIGTLNLLPRNGSSPPQHRIAETAPGAIGAERSAPISPHDRTPVPRGAQPGIATIDIGEPE